MKKRQNKIYSDEAPLDAYEKELKEFLDKGEFVRVKDFESRKKIFQEAAKNFIELQKTKRITLRVKNADLIKVKAKAKRSSIPYQRLLNALIHQFAEDKTDITI